GNSRPNSAAGLPPRGGQHGANAVQRPLFTPGEARISERGPLVTGFATPQPVLHAVFCELLLGGAWRTMLIPKRYGYFVFGFIQSGFTRPFVLVAAPFINRAVAAPTRGYE